MYYVYVLLSEKDGNWYTGYTDDLKRRFEEHNKGLVYASRKRRPFKLIYYEACSHLSCKNGGQKLNYVIYSAYYG